MPVGSSLPQFLSTGRNSTLLGSESTIPFPPLLATACGGIQQHWCPGHETSWLLLEGNTVLAETWISKHKFNTRRWADTTSKYHKCLLFIRKSSKKSLPLIWTECLRWNHINNPCWRMVKGGLISSKDGLISSSLRHTMQISTFDCKERNRHEMEHVYWKLIFRY